MQAAKKIEVLDDLGQLNSEMAHIKAGQRIARLYERFGDRLVASSSFGIQAAVMLKLIKDNAPSIPIVFLDTGYLFPETYQYAQQLTELLDLDIRVFNPTMTPARQEALYGKLWEQGLEGHEKYALLNKVEPMNRSLAELGADVWISGVRRSHSSTRAERNYIEQQKRTIKAYPILDWADAQVEVFFNQHNLPRHPLAEKGYVTMGDWHSTVPLTDENSAEGTRYGGEKYECGLHETSNASDFQI